MSFSVVMKGKGRNYIIKSVAAINQTNIYVRTLYMFSTCLFFSGLSAGNDPTHGSGQEGLKMSWVGSVGSGGVQNVTSQVGSGRVNNFSILAGRIGSGQEALKSHGSVQVGSRGFQISRVGSGRFMRCLKCHGSGRVMTREIRATRGSGHNDPRVVFG